jgi:hypothetical protein
MVLRDVILQVLKIAWTVYHLMSDVGKHLPVLYWLVIETRQ